MAASGFLDVSPPPVLRDPPSVAYYDDGESFALIQERLVARMPLYGLTLGGATMTPLHLTFVRYDNLRFQFPSLPVNLYRRPYVHINCVRCEDHDAYKSSVRAKLRAWVEERVERTQEWLIVYLPVLAEPTAPRGKQEQQAKNNKKLSDRLRSDFSSSRQERVLRIELGEDTQRLEEQLDDLTTKLRDHFLFAFETRIALYEEEIRRLEENRWRPGWNYFNFFTVKEGLAFMYEQTGLVELALREYDDLETYAHALEEYAVFGGSEEGDEDAPIIDILRKPFRELILKNTITLFDFRHYLFARQCQLLFLLGQPMDVAHRALVFVDKFSQDLVRNEKDLPEHFLNVWGLTAFLNLADAFECYLLSPERAQSGRSQAESVASSEVKEVDMDEKNREMEDGDEEVVIREDKREENQVRCIQGDLYRSARGRLEKIAEVCDIQYGRKEFATAFARLFDPTQDVIPASVVPRDGAKMSEGEEIVRPVQSDTEEADVTGLTDATQISAAVLAHQLTRSRIDSMTHRRQSVHAHPLQPAASTEAENSSPQPSEPSRPNAIMRRPLVRNAMRSKLDFEDLFIRFSEMAAECYRRAHRKRTMQLVRAEIAFVYFQRGDFQQAEVLLQEQLGQFLQEGWYALLGVSLSRIAVCQKATQNWRDYIVACLGMLSPFQIRRTEAQTLHYIHEIVHTARILAQEDKGGVLCDLRALFPTSVTFEHKRIHFGEDIVCKVKIHSHLPVPLEFDRASLLWVPVRRRLSLDHASMESTLTNVVIHPGDNQLAFSCQALRTGNFLCDSLSLLLGGLSLEENLGQRHTSEIVSVVESTPSIKLDVTHLPCFIAGHTQAIRIRIALEMDSMAEGTLEIASPTGLVFPDSADSKLLVFSVKSTVPRRELPCPMLNGSVHLPSCTPRDELQLDVPVLVGRDDTTPSHELVVSLFYTKHTTEQVTIAQMECVPVTKPFAMSEVITNTHEGQFLLQIHLQSLVPFPLVIFDYEFLPSTRFVLQSDPNDIIRGMGLSSKGRISFAFEMSNEEVEHTNISSICQLVVHFRLAAPEEENSDPLFHLNVSESRFLLLQKGVVEPWFEVDVMLPTHAIVGEGADLVIKVKRTLESSISDVVADDVKYFLEYDAGSWIFSGRKRGTLCLKPGQEDNLPCHMVPVRAGYLPPPRGKGTFHRRTTKGIRPPLMVVTVGGLRSYSDSEPDLRSIRISLNDFLLGGTPPRTPPPPAKTSSKMLFSVPSL